MEWSESIVATEPTLKDKGRDRRSHPDSGSRGHIGWVVAGSLATGPGTVGSATADVTQQPSR
jgi:hypothetical protein